MKTIGIIGCGWLGKALGTAWVTQGNRVLGTTTQSSNLTALNQLGIEGQLMELTETQLLGNLNPLLECSSWIFAIPPQLRKGAPENFIHRLEVFGKSLSEYTGQFIYLSSSGVYRGREGVCKSSDIFMGETSRAQYLLDGEQLIRKWFPKAMILRLGGLIGPNRHPIRQLAGRKILNPKSRINFLHQIDAIGGIHQVVHTNMSGKTFNLVCPSHPERETYYEQMADLAQLPRPIFGEQIEKIKQVEGLEFCKKTGYNYRIKDLVRLD